MIKIIFLVLVILLTFDGFFRDGYLIEVFFSREMHIPFFVKGAYLIIAIVASALLFHALIWELNLMPKPEEKKTEYQKKKEEEEEERRLKEEEEEKQKEEERLKEIEKQEKESVNNEGRKYLL